MDTEKSPEVDPAPEHPKPEDQEQSRDDELIARLRKDVDNVRPGKPAEDNAPVDIDVNEVELPY